jgi:hypothetical protein
LLAGRPKVVYETAAKRPKGVLQVDATGAALRDEHAKEHAVEVIDLLSEKNYDRVVDEIASADRVISW